MPQVLGRVTQDTDRPRGPDARLDVRVPKEWLESGATLEVELPRNLTCATCEGGGCDVCERSGAVALRSRREPPEIVEVTIPARAAGQGSAPSALMLRIPDHGGLPQVGVALPRGNLLLRVRGGTEPDAGVARIRSSFAPYAPSSPPSVPVLSSRAPAPEAPERWKLLVLALAAAAVFAAFWRALSDLID